MQELVRMYIQSKSLSWAETTLDREGTRLSGFLDVLDGSPERLWKAMQSKRLMPYTKRTTWIRVVQFWQWGIDNGHLPGPNKYDVFRRTNARLFKHVYQRRHPEFSLNEARDKINTIQDEALRNQALCLLDHGLRVSELRTLEENQVRGKGGKSRKTFGTVLPTQVDSYWKVYRALKKIGLKPHDLRKIRATDLAAQGLTEADLCKVFGWESFATASSYLAPKKDLTLEQIFRRSFK